MKETFIIAGNKYLVGLALATPAIGPVAAWFVNVFLSPFITWVLRKLTEWVMMQSFFLNTAIRKSAQATDYVKAVEEKLNLPEGYSEEEYEKAEKKELDAFYNFVRVTN